MSFNRGWWIRHVKMYDTPAGAIASENPCRRGDSRHDVPCAVGEGVSELPTPNRCGWRKDIDFVRQRMHVDRTKRSVQCASPSLVFFPVLGFPVVKDRSVPAKERVHPI